MKEWRHPEKQLKLLCCKGFSCLHSFL